MTQPLPLSERFTAAFDLARTHHANQQRKGTDGVPYIAHLMGVSSIALDFGADEDEAIAALLHDAVEDEGGGPQMLARIEADFGHAVAEIVSACSDTDADPKPPWQQRKDEYIASLAVKPERALLVSAADKLHNARAILSDYRIVGVELWDRFNVSEPALQLAFYRGLSNAFMARATSDAPRIVRLATELERVVVELELELG